MIDIDQAIEAFVNIIKNTEVYRDYCSEKERVKVHPGLKEQIDEFREKNFELQSTDTTEELLERIEELDSEYAVFRENPLVDSFLAAELSFCRMMQKIYADLSDKIEFE